MLRPSIYQLLYIFFLSTKKYFDAMSLDDESSARFNQNIILSYTLFYLYMYLKSLELLQKNFNAIHLPICVCYYSYIFVALYLYLRTTSLITSSESNLEYTILWQIMSTFKSVYISVFLHHYSICHFYPFYSVFLSTSLFLLLTSIFLSHFFLSVLSI